MMDWHLKLYKKVQQKLGLSGYQMAWLGFLKGLLIGAIVYHYFLIHYFYDIVQDVAIFNQI